MKRNTKNPAVVTFVTGDRTTAHVTIRDFYVIFQNGVEKLAVSSMTAVAAYRYTGDSDTAEIEVSKIAQEDMEHCGNALRARLAEITEAEKPRKLTFAQVQKIYGRSVD